MTENINLNKINKIFFIGIGGIGISAAARILKEQGKEILGSDAVASEITEQLKNEGIKVFIPQAEENISADIDLAVYTVAAPEDNPERQKAKQLGVTEITYPQLLGLLMRDKFGIGISGTNGKTTTTAMIGKIFMAAGLDPTIVVGSKVDYLNGNSRAGQGKHFIFESDEYRRAFDNYQPRVAVITYIIADHLDYYKDLAEIRAAFGSYLKRAPADGFIIINNDDENSLAAAKDCQAKIISYGIENEAEVQAKNIQIADGRQTFDLFAGGKNLGQIVLPLPARYNIYNALAAIVAARTQNIDLEIIKSALADFHGAWRRFERLGKSGETEIITDYAHTPDAVRKTILAAKEFYPEKKILIVFQPHQYNRTKNFFEDFAGSFSEAKKVIIPDIYYVAGRENPADFDVNSEKLVEAVREKGVDAEYGGDLASAENSIREKLNDFDAVLIMGAGDVYELAKKLVIINR